MSASGGILGQGARLRQLLASARALRLHHGLLLEGARGGGKSSAARLLAQALLCETPGAVHAPCGACGICARVASGNHPDVYCKTIPEEKQDIGVDTVRELQEELGRHAMEGRARVAILDPADRLTAQAQNALLKTLEEPGADTFLLLPATRPESLLPTVRSRVDRLRLLPLDEATLHAELAARGAGKPEERALAARLCGGSLGLALTLLEQGVAALQPRVVAFLGRPNDISAVGLARELLAGTEDKLAADARLRLVLVCLRATLRQALHASLARAGAVAYPGAPTAAWARAFDSLFDAEEDLELRIAPLHVLTHALLGLQEAGLRACA